MFSFHQYILLSLCNSVLYRVVQVLCISLLPASFYYPSSRLLVLLEGELYIAICKGGTDKVILTRGNISRYTCIEGEEGDTQKKMN